MYVCMCIPFGFHKTTSAAIPNEIENETIMVVVLLLLLHHGYGTIEIRSVMVRNVSEREET